MLLKAPPSSDGATGPTILAKKRKKFTHQVSSFLPLSKLAQSLGSFPLSLSLSLPLSLSFAVEYKCREN
jgi:hypothetical protein